MQLSPSNTGVKRRLEVTGRVQNSLWDTRRCVQSTWRGDREKSLARRVPAGIASILAEGLGCRKI